MSKVTRRSTNRIDPALKRELAKAVPRVCEMAIEAGGFIRRKFGKFRDLRLKADASLVTEADRGAERIVTRALKRYFPEHEILGEEMGLSRKKSGSLFRWHIDPLDGTTNFVHGFPFFCVSIGLEFEPLGPVLGVVYQPITNDLYTASHGGGAYRNRRKIAVSRTNKLSHALLSTGFSMDKSRLKKDAATFVRMVRGSHSLRRTGSAALDLTHVATGQFDGFWERGLNSWDVVAALTILSEAGGTYSRMDGNPYCIGDKTVLATNSTLHRAVVRALDY